MKPQIATPAAYELFHSGCLALAEVEAAGIRVDTELLDESIERVGARNRKLEARIRDDEVFHVWRRSYGEATNLGSRTQLAQVLYGKMGIRAAAATAKGARGSTSKLSLSGIDLPFVRRYLKIEDLKKLRGTFLAGIRREVVGGFLHPFFSLGGSEKDDSGGGAKSYRGSSQMPNFQNFPIRDPYAGRLIRSLFIPRPGRILAEVDYGAIEFIGAACFWKDPAMIDYASNPALDIHRDQAMVVYGLKKSQVSKDARYCAKNNFVFPVLYGSYYIQMCKNLWDDIGKRNLKVMLLGDDPKAPTGPILYDHLANKYGITELGDCDPNQKPRAGTFERHVKEAEDQFMASFPMFAAARQPWIDKYRKRGSFRMMTGFVAGGLMTNNQLMNLGIQGPMFHCLLWSLIRTVKEIRRRRMGALVVGQIHDCKIGDVPEAELQEYLDMTERIMTVEIRKAWPWIVVPLKVEVDCSSTNWHEKSPWIKREGKWGPK